MPAFTDPLDPDRIRVTVAIGETTEPVFVSRETVVTVIPGSGGTMNAQATWSQAAIVRAGAANWFDWDAGAVSTRANQLLLNATAVRFIAATAAGVGEVAR